MTTIPDTDDWVENFSHIMELKQKEKEWIKAVKKSGKGEVKTLVCPKCANTLQMGVAFNGHTRGQCQTKGCLRWLE